MAVKYQHLYRGALVMAKTSCKNIYFRTPTNIALPSLQESSRHARNKTAISSY